MHLIYAHEKLVSSSVLMPNYLNILETNYHSDWTREAWMLPIEVVTDSYVQSNACSHHWLSSKWYLKKWNDKKEILRLKELWPILSELQREKFSCSSESLRHSRVSWKSQNLFLVRIQLKEIPTSAEFAQQWQLVGVDASARTFEQKTTGHRPGINKNIKNRTFLPENHPEQTEILQEIQNLFVTWLVQSYLPRWSFLNPADVVSIQKAGQMKMVINSRQ